MKHKESWYTPNKIIHVNDKMQKKYTYTLKYKIGTNLKKGENGEIYNFEPYYTPKEMLKMGVFEGKYLNDCYNEFPMEWYKSAKTSKIADPKNNYFKIKSRLSLQQWQKNGWVPIHDKNNLVVVKVKDVRGWFHWYCRYYLGRRLSEIDDIQIKRWRSFARHFAQVKKNARGDITKRPKQRQALLQWSWNCKI